MVEFHKTLKYDVTIQLCRSRIENADGFFKQVLESNPFQGGR